jgi:hypothetical protein
MLLCTLYTSYYTILYNTAIASLKDAVQKLDSFYLKVRLEAAQQQAGAAAAAECKQRGVTKELTADAVAAASESARPAGRCVCNNKLSLFSLLYFK